LCWFERLSGKLLSWILWSCWCDFVLL